jgi:hypothetical protein
MGPTRLFVQERNNVDPTITSANWESAMAADDKATTRLVIMAQFKSLKILVLNLRTIPQRHIRRHLP